MKKTLKVLLSVLLINTFAYSQRLDDPKKWKNPCPACLPGVSYGFNWPDPPVIPDPDPSTPPVILNWAGDLAVVMFQTGQIYQDRDRPYFTVVYSITVTNVNAQGPLSFNLKLSKRFNPPQFTVLDPSVLNVPDKFYQIKNLTVDRAQTFEDTIHVLYPLSAKSRGAKSKFLEIPVDIIAEIPTTGFRSAGNFVNLTDPNQQNNKTKITLTTPLPLNYVKPNPN